MAQVDPARRAGPVRRRAGDVPHEDRELADGGDRGAPARRRLRRGRQVARPADASRTWPCRTARSSTRRPARRRSAARSSRRWPASTRVSGPGMLDFLLVFSLPKLVFDDEMCGQALRFVREVRAAGRPAGRRADRPADGRPAPDHGRRTRRRTGRRELYLPSADHRSRQPRGLDAGRARRTPYERATDEVDRRLGAYRQLETDPAIDAELQRIIRSGLVDQTELPLVPPAPEPIAPPEDETGGRRRNRRRGPIEA